MAVWYTQNTTEAAAVSRSTSHVTTKQRCEYTTSADTQNAPYSHYFRIICDKSAASLFERVDQRCIKKFFKAIIIKCHYYIIKTQTASCGSVAETKQAAEARQHYKHRSYCTGQNTGKLHGPVLTSAGLSGVNFVHAPVLFAVNYKRRKTEYLY